MNSKTDRLISSIDNVLLAISYYIKDIETKYLMNQINKKDYLKLTKDFNEIKNILTNLKLPKNLGNKNLDTIRVINFSIMSMYQEGDYSAISNEINKINNDISKEAKEIDRKYLGDLKRIYKSLPNFYQFRLTKAEKKGVDGLTYHDKGFDNIRFIITNYLNVKYNLKKINYEPIVIDTDNPKIEAAITIKYLSKMLELCNEKEYSELSNLITKIMPKYQKIAGKSNEAIEVEKEERKNKDRKEDIKELKGLLQTIRETQEKTTKKGTK